MLESGGPIEFRQGVWTVGVDEKIEKKKIVVSFFSHNSRAVIMHRCRIA